MKINFLEIFFIFWISALLWIIIEFVYYRLQRHADNKKGVEGFREE